MKKTLIALAALAATGAFAQSSVTLYGRADVGYANSVTTNETAAGSVDTKNNGVNSHNSVSSLWGIKGTEDLGGGLKANFIFEADLFPATGNTGFSGALGGNASNGAFDRTSLLGVSGGFGEINFGKDYTPLFKVVAASDVFALSRLSTVQLAGVDGGTLARQMIYTTPNFSGFSAKLAIGNTDTSVGAAEAVARNSSLVGSYVNGPLYAALALGNQETVAGAATAKNEAQALTVTYDFGAAKLFAGYVAQKATTTGVAGSADRTETNLGLNIPFGKAAVQLAYGRNTQSSNVAAALADRSGNDWGLGVSYDLSKRTALFAKTGVVNKLDGTINGATSNTKLTETNFGVRHTF